LVASPARVSRPAALIATLAIASLVLSVLLWERLSTLQEQLARQTADAGVTASEARTLVRQTQEQERDLAARTAVLEARISELNLQRSQLEDLMQSLSRSRDENLVIDMESSLRLAQQQAQLTGSVEPLLAALHTAEQRIQRAPQARLAPVSRAITQDVARIKSTPVMDTPTLLARLDELVREVDELPLANAVGSDNTVVPTGKIKIPPVTPSWWQRAVQGIWSEGRQLVRVSRIEDPEAVLLSPEQSFFLRENLKLLLLNAHLGLLARQPDAARADLTKAIGALNRYFDLNLVRTRAAISLMQQTRDQMKSLELPRVDATLAALSHAASGR
jgi:uroporphyrin-3 C-methyltransferase